MRVIDRPDAAGDGEIARTRVDLDAGPVIGPVEPGNAALAAPGVLLDADQVEKPAHVRRGDAEERFEPAPAG